MKRAIVSLLASALILGSLAGCSSSEASSSSSAAGTPSVASSEPDAASAAESGQPSGEIEIWCWDPNFNIPAAETAARYYNEVNPNVTVKVTEVTSNEIYTRLTAMVTGGQTDQLPDIMLMHDRNIVKYVTTYEGIFAPLDQSGINFDEFAQYKVAAGSVDGVPYGVPFDNGVAMTAIRTDLLEPCGYTIEDFTDITWDRFIEIGTDVYSQIGKPITIDRSDTLQLVNTMLQSTGNWYFNEDGSVNIANNEVLKEIFRIYQDLINNNVMIRLNDGDSYYNALWTDTTAGLVNACWMLGSVTQAEEQAGKWQITNIPRLEGIEGALNYSNNGGSSWLVFEGGNKEAAMDYLKNTFAGSVEFYNEILPTTSAIATWLPAQEGSNYVDPQPFFADQPIYKMLMEYSAEIPRVDYQTYSDEAYTAINTALAAVLSGTSVEDALQEAESQVAFMMQ